MKSEDLLANRRIKDFVRSLPQDLLNARSNVDLQYTDDILPFDLYRGTRTIIVRIADQINQSYCFGVYDGCAVLMRRLIESLLVFAYKEFHIEDQIKGDNENYLPLAKIIDRAIQNKTLDLSQEAKDNLDPFREKGNFSAHNPFYYARKRDIELYQHKYRQLVEELMHKANLIS